MNGRQEIAPVSIDCAYAAFLRTGEVLERSRLAWLVAPRAFRATGDAAMAKTKRPDCTAAIEPPSAEQARRAVL